MTTIDEYLIKGNTYRRKELHAIWGGSSLKGISVSPAYPFIFLFVRKQLYGNEYGWDENGIFHYAAERKNGDVQLTGNNKQIIDHVSNNKRVFIFQSLGEGKVEYVDEMIYIGYGQKKVVDINNENRDSIIFKFRRKSESIDHLGLYPDSEFENNIILRSNKKNVENIDNQAGFADSEFEAKVIVNSNEEKVKGLDEKGDPQGKEAISDKITNKDLLGRDILVEELSDFYIEYNESNHSPFYFGIFARWGMGKSSVIEMLKNSIQGKSTEKNKYLVCKVDCSLFDKKDKLWSTILNQLLDELSFKSQDKDKPVYKWNIFLRKYNLLSFKNKFYFINTCMKIWRNKLTASFWAFICTLAFLGIWKAPILNLIETKGFREIAALITVLTFVYALFKAGAIIIKKNVFLNDERREESSYFLSINEYKLLIESLNKVKKRNDTNIKVLLVLDELDRIHKDLLPDIIELIQLFKGLNNELYATEKENNGKDSVSQNDNENYKSGISFAFSFNHDVLFPVVGRSVSLEDKQLFIQSYRDYKGFVEGKEKDAFINYYKLGKEYMDKYLDLSLYLEDKINYEKLVEQLFVEAHQQVPVEDLGLQTEIKLNSENIGERGNERNLEVADTPKESEEMKTSSFTNKEKEIIKEIICKYASNVEPRKIIRLKNALILLKKLNRDIEFEMENQYEKELGEFILKFLEIEYNNEQEAIDSSNLEIAAAAEGSLIEKENRYIKYTNYFIHSKSND
ncbi:P-loop NTPase fold protein [Bacillus toyonensis]|uniref:P-loop NTPase fold protein n=1 Tax=Bacillus toyonensis TaxID=155322 RepID=UPI003D302B83